MLKPDLVGYDRGLNTEWTRLEQYETAISKRPLDLHRPPADSLRSYHHTAEPLRFSYPEAGFGNERDRRLMGGGAQPMRAAGGVMLAAGLHEQHSTMAVEHDTVRNDFALGYRRAETPRGRE